MDVVGRVLAIQQSMLIARVETMNELSRRTIMRALGVVLAVMLTASPALGEGLTVEYYEGSFAGPLLKLDLTLHFDGRLIRRTRHVEWQALLDAREKRLASALLDSELIGTLRRELEGWGAQIADGGVYVYFRMDGRSAHYSPGWCDDPLPDKTAELRQFLNLIIARYFGKPYEIPSCGEQRLEY